MRQGKEEGILAIAGWRGLAGREILDLLLSRGRRAGSIILLGGRRGGEAPPAGTVHRPLEEDLVGIDLLFLALPPLPALRLGRRARPAGVALVDLSGAVAGSPPLVARLNPGDLPPGSRVASSPNCVSVLLALGLAGLHRAVPVRQVIVTTFQSVSGAGRAALGRLRRECRGEGGPLPAAGRLAGNLLPRIGAAPAGGASREEADLARQVPHLLGAPALQVEANCVRVPVERGHSFMVHCRLAHPLTLAAAAAALAGPAWVEVGEEGRTPLETVGSQRIHVGRIRESDILTPGLSFWLTGDQLLLGAALNAVELAQLLLPGAAIWETPSGGSP